MKKIIAIANQKGGVGKTSTAIALSAGLHNMNKKVLAIDLDAQSDLTLSSRVESGPGVFEVLTGSVKIKDAIRTSPAMGDILSGSPALSGLEAILTKIGKEYKLKEAIKDIYDDYEHIIIDTPPSLGLAMLNALVAADTVIVPVEPDGYSLTGIVELANTIDPVRQYVNPGITIDGLLVSNVDFRERSTVSMFLDTLKTAEEILGAKAYDTIIRRATAVSQAQFRRQNVYEFAPKSGVVEDYNNFLKALLGKE